MMIRSLSVAVPWLVPALFLASCAGSSNSAGDINRPSNTESDLGSSSEALPEPPTAIVSEDSPTSTNPPSSEPVQATTPPQVMLPDLGPAPDITNEVWLNTDQPLNLAALRGRVVLVEFWTFG